MGDWFTFVNFELYLKMRVLTYECFHRIKFIGSYLYIAVITKFFIIATKSLVPLWYQILFWFIIIVIWYQMSGIVWLFWHCSLLPPRPSSTQIQSQSMHWFFWSASREVEHLYIFCCYFQGNSCFCSCILFYPRVLLCSMLNEDHVQ